MCLANNIRYLRRKYNFSQDYIAEKLGYKSYTTIQKWEMGVSEPSIAKLRELADIFGVDINDMTTKNIEKAEAELAQTPELTARDERDIKKDLDSLMEKLANNEYGPAAFDGEDIPEDDRELFAGQLELMLRRLKTINKEKYNPQKNKK